VLSETTRVQVADTRSDRYSVFIPNGEFNSLTMIFHPGLTRHLGRQLFVSLQSSLTGSRHLACVGLHRHNLLNRLVTWFPGCSAPTVYLTHFPGVLYTFPRGVLHKRGVIRICAGCCATAGCYRHVSGKFPTGWGCVLRIFRGIW
jgi:hypothetical protein